MVLERIVTGAARIAAVGLVLLAAACDSVEERVADHHERGVELAEAGENEKASLEFRNALKLDENHAPSRLGLARIFEARGELSAAMGNYRAAAELDRSNVEARVKLAQIMLAGGRDDEARAYLDEAVALAPEDVEVLAAQAALAMRGEDLDAALDAATAAVAKAPDHLSANLVLISLKYRDNDVEGALAHLDRMLAVAPQDMALNLFKLRILEADNRQDGLGDHLSVMTGRFPDESQFRRAYAQWLLQQGRGEEAEDELRSVAAQSPDDMARALDVVRLVGAQSGAAAAVDELRSRIEAANDPVKTLPLTIALTQLLVEEDRRDEATAALQMVVDAAPDGEAGHDARVRIARIAYAAGDAERARALVDETLAADVANVDGLVMRARLALDDENPAAAAESLGRALDLAPDNVEATLLDAMAQTRLGNLEIAGDRLASAMRKSEYAPGVTLEYASFLRARGRSEAAETVVIEALQRAPENRRLLAALAELRIAMEDWDGAEEVAARFAALDPEDDAAARVRATALGRQGRLEDAMVVLRDLAESPNAERAAIGGLVAGYVQLGETDKARALIEERLAENPADIQMLLLRAELALRDGDAEAAMRDARTMIDAAPDNVTGYVATARLAFAQGDAAGGEAALRAAIGSVRDERPARLMLGAILEQRGDFEGAIDEYAALYELDRDSAVYANNYASLLAEHRADDPESLQRAARIALRLQTSQVPELQDTYGWTQFLIGNHDAALRALAPAAGALPNNALVQYHAGRAYAALGQTAEARRHLDAALSLDPGFPKAASAQEALDALPAANGNPGAGQ